MLRGQIILSGAAFNVSKPCFYMRNGFPRATCAARQLRDFSSSSSSSERQTAVFTWGLGTMGQLGHEKFPLTKSSFLGTENYFQDTPRRLVRSKQYTAISCGNSYTLGLTESGEIFGWGKGFAGEDSQSNTPVKIDTSAATKRGRRIKSIIAGPRHMAAIDNEGSVLTWGHNGGWYDGGGQLGHGGVSSAEAPKYVTTLDDHGIRCAEVSLGDQHTVFRTEDGAILTCGDGSFGRLGTGETGNVETPSAVTELIEQNIVQVAAGHSHTLALSDKGKVFAWGKNDKGQIGINDAHDVTSMEIFPTEVEFPAGNIPSFISAGQKRNVVVTKEGNLFVWGWDLNHIPTIVDRSSLGNMKIKKAFCGGEKHRCLTILTEDGSLWTTGHAGNHMLGWEGAKGLQHAFTRVGVKEWSGRALHSVHAGRFHIAVIADML